MQIDKVASRVKRLTLAPINSQALVAFAAGSHIKVGIPKLASVKPAPFSLTGSARDARHYQIIAHRRNNSGRITRWLYDEAVPGEIVEVSDPRCGLKLHPQAAHHCLVAGGSGIAAFFSHLDELRRAGHDYELHYVFRERSEGIWCDDLRAEHGERVRQYVTSEGERLDLSRLLSMQPAGTHVYVCGPPRLIQAAVNAAWWCGFPSEALHWDAYGWRPSAVTTKHAPCAFPWQAAHGVP